jgi:hypothetical protein
MGFNKATFWRVLFLLLGVGCKNTGSSTGMPWFTLFHFWGDKEKQEKLAAQSDIYEIYV